MITFKSSKSKKQFTDLSSHRNESEYGQNNKSNYSKLTDKKSNKFYNYKNVTIQNITSPLIANK